MKNCFYILNWASMTEPLNMLWNRNPLLVNVLPLYIMQYVQLNDFHRPFNEVMVNSSFELISFWFGHGFPSSETLLGKKPGSLGSTNSISLPKIRTTEVMVGLSSGYCCTHKRLTWMHRNTSETTHESFILESINSNAFPSFQSVHAWNNKRKNKK